MWVEGQSDGCDRPLIDPNHYMFQCKGRNTFVGHNAITKIVLAMYKQLGVQTKKEVLGLVEGQERPADVLVLPAAVRHGAALPVALDVGVTDPGSDSAVLFLAGTGRGVEGSGGLHAGEEGKVCEGERA